MSLSVCFDGIGAKLPENVRMGYMEAEVLRPGADTGDRMVAKFTCADGLVVHAIGVPQAWPSSLGPTWSYVLEADKLTLVDTGGPGSIGELEAGLEWLGYPLSAVERVILTHGHMDHDGSCFKVIAQTGAELWAHEVYGTLVGLDGQEMDQEWRRRLKDSASGRDRPEMDEAARAHIQEYRDAARRIEVTNLVTDGLACDGLTFFYTPGHSPDQLCIQYGKVLFTGDHVLPQITPHPSVGSSYAKFRDALPPGYQNDNQYFGLKTFMKSLKRVAAMAPDISVLPAHRAYFHGKFNLTGVERAQEILEHHRERCYDLLGLIRKESDDMESITHRHFSGRHLEGANFYMAMSEVISHIEFLQEVGDVEVVGKDESQVRWTGSENYGRAIDEL